MATRTGSTAGTSASACGASMHRNARGPAERNTAALTKISTSERLTCRERDIDRYGRIVGQCFLRDGGDVAELMIAAGVAAEHCRYSGGSYGTC